MVSATSDSKVGDLLGRQCEVPVDSLLSEDHIRSALKKRWKLRLVPRTLTTNDAESGAVAQAKNTVPYLYSAPKRDFLIPILNR